MILYHFSSKPLLVVEVGKFGQNYYTRNDAKISDLPRSFWYINPDEREEWFTHDYMHSVYVDDGGIYDMRANYLGLGMMNAGEIDTTLKALKFVGYLGVQYGNVVNLFHDVIVKCISKPRELVI